MSMSSSPLLSGGGVDASIPLQAGKGVQQSNPLQAIGNFAQVQNQINQNKLFPGQMTEQQQTIQGNQLALAQKLKQTAYQHLAAGVADGSINDLPSVTNALAGLEHNYGIVTSGVLNDITNLGGSGPDFSNRLKGLVTANTQPPDKAVAALAPAGGTMNVGGQLIPTLTPAAGMPGQGVPVQSAPGYQVGYTPGQQMEGIHRAATQADVDAGRATAIGQDIVSPATTVPATAGYNPGVGGARMPAPGSLGPGGYQAPDLTRLGPRYQAPGAAPVAASPAGGAPTLTPNPAAPTVAPSGSRVMRGPGGTFTVPADKIVTFQQNGYQ
jgi:hypothetical protein